MANDSYMENVRRIVRDAVYSGASSLRDVLSAARGAPPELVLPILERLGFGAVCEADQHMEHHLDDKKLEPHLLDADWRFSEKTRHWLAEYLAPFDRILLLGVPSLYEILRAGRRPQREVFLIDRRLDDSTHDQILNLDIRHLDFPQHRMLLADACLMDAPWYPDDIHAWLRTAFLCVRPGGRIMFSLWPEMTRPGAQHERNIILRELGRYGDVRLFRNALAYDTPLFEKYAYASRNIAVPDQWRFGDLVEFSPSVVPALTEPPHLKLTWHRYAFGGYQIAVRQPKRRGNLKDFRAWTLESVSRRDRRRAAVDVWDSHNRVAQSDDNGRFIELLDRACTGSGRHCREFELLLRSGFFVHGIPSEGAKWLQLD